MDIFEQIERDIEGLDPSAEERISKQQEHRRVKRIGYNKRAYSKNRNRLRQQARARYIPVIQSYTEQEPIDYDEL